MYRTNDESHSLHSCVGSTEMLQKQTHTTTTTIPQTTNISDTSPTPPTIQSVLKCPGCDISLAKMLKQQGAGGWKHISIHLARCQLKSARARTLTPTAKDTFIALELLSNSQCAANDECKAARKAAAPERRQAAAAAAEVPWFIAQQRKSQVPETAAAVNCTTCGAQFSANDSTSFAQHSERCAHQRVLQLQHLTIQCEATADKAKIANQRVEVLQRTVDKAKAALNKKQAAIEEEKRKKRAHHGKKKRTVKKLFVSPAADITDKEEAQNQSTIHGCMQRLKDAEKATKEARQRALFREQTAQIASAEAEGVEHPLVAKRAVQSKHQKYEKKLQTFRKEQRRKSKETLSKEKTEKSKDKSMRRVNADSKQQGYYNS